jgi:hypothetical protein
MKRGRIKRERIKRQRIKRQRNREIHRNKEIER